MIVEANLGARLLYEPFDPRDGVHTLGLLSTPIEITRLLKSILG
jgi:hypothetical protein